MSKIQEADLKRIKWYGYFYRKNNDNYRHVCRVQLCHWTQVAFGWTA